MPKPDSNVWHGTKYPVEERKLSVLQPSLGRVGKPAWVAQAIGKRRAFVMGEIARNLIVILFWFGVFAVVVYIGYGIFGAPEARKREALEREKEILEKRNASLKQDIDLLTKVNAELREKLHSHGNKKG